MSKAAIRTTLGAGALAGGLTTALAARTPRRPHEEEAIRRYDEARKAGTLTPKQQEQKDEAEAAYRRRGGGNALLKGVGAGLSTAALLDSFTGNNIQKNVFNRAVVNPAQRLHSAKRPYKFLPRAYNLGIGAVGAASLYNLARRATIKPTDEEKERIKRARVGLIAHPGAILENDMTSIRGRVAWNLLDDEAKARDDLKNRQRLVNPWAVGAGVAGSIVAAPFLKDAAVGLGRAVRKSGVEGDLKQRFNNLRGMRTIKSSQPQTNPARMLSPSRNIQVSPPSSYIDV